MCRRGSHSVARFFGQVESQGVVQDHPADKCRVPASEQWQLMIRAESTVYVDADG